METQPGDGKCQVSGEEVLAFLEEVKVLAERGKADVTQGSATSKPKKQVPIEEVIDFLKRVKALAEQEKKANQTKAANSQAVEHGSFM